MAHHGEIDCSPARTAAQNSSQSTHRVSATSSGWGAGAAPEYAAYTGQTSFSSTPLSIRAW